MDTKYKSNTAASQATGSDRLELQLQRPQPRLQSVGGHQLAQPQEHGAVEVAHATRNAALAIWGRIPLSLQLAAAELAFSYTTGRPHVAVIHAGLAALTAAIAFDWARGTLRRK